MTSPNVPSQGAPEGSDQVRSETREAHPGRSLRCSDGARERNDPLVGTAPPAKRWLLIELEGRWLPTAIDSLGLRAQVRSHLATITGRAQARVMLIRRVGRRPPGPHRKWCVIDDPATAAGPVLTWGTWSVGEDLVAAGELLLRQAEGAAQARIDEAPGQTVVRPDPSATQVGPQLLLVCTHGKHDVCCATRGRPVAAALDARWPKETWECSHTGGDRFAANALLLPDGACYGGLDPDTAVSVVTGHYQTGPDTAYLRGRTGLSPSEQAALVAAYRHRPSARWGSFSVGATTSYGTDHMVQIRGESERFEVPITEQVREPHHLTCAATTLNRCTVPVAGELRPL